MTDIREIEMMRMGTDYVFSVQVRTWNVKLRPITISEHMMINNEVVKILTSTPVEYRNRINENWLLAKGILKAASKLDPESPVEPALNDYLLDRMTIDEVLYAYDQYLQGTDAVNPKLEKMSVEKINELVNNVKKKEIQLTDLSFWQLQNIVGFLIQKD